MKNKFIFLSLLAWSALPIHSDATIILLDNTMSKKEQIMTGVSKLNHNQRAALENWLNENFVLKTPEQKVVVPELTLAENIGNGRKIKLSDGSLYEIYPRDVGRAAGWITPFPIVVVPSDDADYPCKLVNKNTGSSLLAHQIPPPNP